MSNSIQSISKECSGQCCPSNVNLTKQHKIRKCAANNLEENRNSSHESIELVLILNMEIWLINWPIIPTFLNTSLVQQILPKHSTKTGFWAFAMIIGSIRLISIGNEYQPSHSIVKLIFSNALYILWPSSHVMNTVANPKIPLKSNSNVDIAFSWCSWNRPKRWISEKLNKLKNKNKIRKEECSSTQLFPLEWLA